MIEKYLQLSHELDKHQCQERIKFEIEFSFFKLKETNIAIDTLINDTCCNWILSDLEFKELIAKAINDISKENNINIRFKNNKIVWVNAITKEK